MKSLVWIFFFISLKQIFGFPYDLLLHDYDSSSSDMDISRALKELDKVSSEEKDEIDMLQYYMRLKYIEEEIENYYLFEDLLEKGFWSLEDSEQENNPSIIESRESLADDGVVMTKVELENASVENNENILPEANDIPNVINVNDLYMNDAPVEEKIIQKNIGQVESYKGSNKYADIDLFLSELNKDLEKENMHRKNAPVGYASPGAEKETHKFNTQSKISPTTERSIWSKLGDKLGHALNKAKEVIQQQ